MARLVTCNFGLQTTSVSGHGEGQGLTIGGVPTIDTGLFRSGAQSLKCLNGLQSATWTGLGVALGNTAYSRTYIYVTTLLNTTSFIGRLFTSGAVPLLTLSFSPSGALQLVNGVTSANIGSPITLSTGRWYRIETSLTVPGAGNGSAEMLVDGISIASTASANFGNAAVDRFGTGILTAVTTGQVNIADVAINDSTGGNQNNYPGSGRIVLLKPVSDNARTGWTAGGLGTTNLFQGVANTPPVGVGDVSATNTSQIRDALVNTTDTYVTNLGAYTDSTASGGGGMSSSAVISLIQTIANFGPVTASACQVGMTLNSNPTLAEDVSASAAATAAATYPTGWTTTRGTVAYNPAVTLATKPALQVRKATSAVAEDVDFMGLYVEYTLPAQTLSGTMSFTGSKAWKTTRPLAAGLTFSGAIGRTILAILVGVLSFTGALSRGIAKQLSAGVSFAGSVSRGSRRSLAASAGFSGSFTKQQVKSLSGALSFSGSISRALGKSLSASITNSGQLGRAMHRSLAATFGTTGSLAKGVSKTVSGTVSFSGSVSKQISKIVTGVIGFAGTVARGVQRPLSASLALSGQIGRSTAKSMSAVLGLAGTLTKPLIKSFFATVGFSGSLGKDAIRSLMATLTLAGQVQKSVGRSLSGLLLLVGQQGRVTQRNLSSAMSFAASVSRSASKQLAGSLSSEGGVSLTTQRAFGATLDAVGTLSRGTYLDLVSTLSFTGSIVRGIGRSLTGVLSFVGGLVARRPLQVNLSASLGFTGNLGSLITRAVVDFFIGLVTRVKRIVQTKNDLTVATNPFANQQSVIPTPSSQEIEVTETDLAIIYPGALGPPVLRVLDDGDAVTIYRA